MNKILSSSSVVMLLAGGQLWNGGQHPMSNPSPLKVLDTVQGSSFLAIASVLQVFERHNLKLSQYKIFVVLEGELPTIVFRVKEGAGSSPRDFGVRAGSNLQLSPPDLSFLLSKMEHLKVVDTMQGTSVPPIETAAAIFQQRNTDIAQYKITLLSEGQSEVVTFVDKGTKPGTRGGLGKHPGFEVEMNATDLRVLRSNFVR
jgi:hypothetical protein